jgi:prolyl-tRNA synthetase
MQRALDVTRAQNFPDWYQAVVREADMAEPGPARGSMIIKPWGWGVWERVQKDLDQRIKDSGHENCYFPLFIPLSFIAKEAQHVEGFAKEMAVVTHHRLKLIDGKLKPDPDALLEEPLIVRPTSETIIGDAFSRWIKSYRDLPILINQWANIVRWEMRTRLFLRTTEFLWQEGHTAHTDEASARAETLEMLGVYRSFSEATLAMPVVAGEKPESERFPGAVNTYSIEAMMQDGKALQAATSHYLGQNFAVAQNIRYQTDDGDLAFCHTTSWGLSTRVIGGVIMTHGDDDGLRLPPTIAPRQVIVIPMLRGVPEDAVVLQYCESLITELGAQKSFDEPVRVAMDKRRLKPIEKRWNWVRRGVPIVIEIGLRDVTDRAVTYIRRDQLRDGDKVKSATLPREQLLAQLPEMLKQIQVVLYQQAKLRTDNNIAANVTNIAELREFFGAAANGKSQEEEFRGWVRAPWSRPTGKALQVIEEQLKTLKLSLRNVPLDQPDTCAPCLFTGAPGVEEVLISRAY